MDRIKSILPHVRAAHEQVVADAATQQPLFQIAAFMKARGLDSKDADFAAKVFARTYGDTARGVHRKLAAEQREKAGGMAQSSTIAKHAEALRAHIEHIVANAEQVKLGEVARFLAERRVKCDQSVRTSFTAKYGSSPYGYYIDLLVARVLELRAERPRIAKAWIMLRTGASESAVDRVLTRLDCAAQEKAA